KEIKDLIRISLPPGVSLDLDVEAGPLPVKADPSQIRQVVMNLVINAYEALGGGPGSIVLKAGTDEGSPSLNRFFVEIRDTGCGMDEEVLTRVFEPFFTTKFTGRGLGLSAALGIIRESGGDISITTEPGRGTLVRFVLPGLEGADRRPEGGMHREGGGSVLVIDDEDAVREVTVCMLNRLGYRTIEACDGAEALELYRTRGETIDLVLLDLTMPAMDGAVTLDGLRRLDPAVPVIVVSGVTAAASQEILNRPQTVGYLTKPFTLDELKTAVSRIVQPSA
ncbi:response regulator, partial [bacterium]|nr:response regulator [bacterium]